MKRRRKSKLPSNGNGNGMLERHKQFCKKYIYDWNGTKAYLAVYPNVSEEVAWASSSRLLSNVKVKAYIEELQKETEKLAGISRLMVAQEYMKLAFTSIGHLHNTWIDRKEFDDLTEDQKSCISEIQSKVVKQNVGTKKNPVVIAVEEIRVKLYDRKQALDSLVKFFGYAEPEKYTGKIEHAIKIEEIKTDELSKSAQQMLLEVAKQQLTDGISSN